MAIEVTGDAVVTSDFTVRTASITSVSVAPSFWGVVLSLCFFVGIGYLFKNFSWLVLIGGLIGTGILASILPVTKLTVVAGGKKYAVIGRDETIKRARREIEHSMSLASA